MAMKVAVSPTVTVEGPVTDFTPVEVVENYNFLSPVLELKHSEITINNAVL